MRRLPVYLPNPSCLASVVRDVYSLLTPLVDSHAYRFVVHGSMSSPEVFG